MNPLDQYLSGDHRKDMQELETIKNLISDGIDTLIFSFNNSDFIDIKNHKHSWPYIIGATQEKQKIYSISTNAMILFALNEYQKSSDDLSQVKEILKKGTETLYKQAKKAKKPKKNSAEDFSIWPHDVSSATSGKPLTISRTYGTNDPLSLFWLVSLPPIENKVSLQFIKNVCDFLNKKLSLCQSKGHITNSTSETKIDLHDNAFIYLLILRLLNKIQNNPDIEASLLELIRTTTQCIHKILESKLHKHLSYSNIPDSRFDPAELTFCLEGLLLLEEQGIGDGIINRVFDVLLETQQQTSVFWKPTTPIYAKSTGHILLPLSIEVANSLLRTCELLDNKTQNLDSFIRCIPLFKRYILWLKAQQSTIPIKTKEEEINCIGWASEHTAREDCIHTWQTSQILIFLSRYSKLFNRYIAHITLAKSRLKIHQTTDSKTQKNLLKTESQSDHSQDEPIETFISGDPIGGDWTNNISRIISELYITPRKDSAPKPPCSFLLYGPPGTGKTRITKEIAKLLSWRYLIITPSDFLAGGAAEVEQRAKSIFSMLEEQEELVVLFDEIDHLLLDRESEEYSKLTGIFQFITPGMLPKFADLRDKEKIIFIIATNYAERIDGAIKREGRIDKKLLLLPPDMTKRKGLIKDFLELSTEPKVLLKKAVKSSSLRTWKEIKSACDEVSKEQDEDKLNQFIESVTSEPPSITTEAYYNRFFNENSNGFEVKLYSKSPWKEFVSLFYIENEEKISKEEFKKDFLPPEKYNCFFKKDGNVTTGSREELTKILKGNLKCKLAECKTK